MVAGVVQINFQIPAPYIHTPGPYSFTLSAGWQILGHGRHLCDTIGLELVDQDCILRRVCNLLIGYP